VSEIVIQADGKVGAIARLLAGMDPQRARQTFARAINREGGKVTTQVRRATATATGLPYGYVTRVARPIRASAALPEFAIKASDAATSLKRFGPRLTRKGVSAAPWAKRRVFSGSFVAGKLGGHVFARAGVGRMPIKKLFGPVVPNEMISGEPASAWEGAAYQLSDAVLREIERQIFVGIA